MAVDSPHPKYTRMLPEWQRNLDAVAGEQTIKLRKDTYLPVPNADQTDVTSDRYRSYLKRAVFTNYTGRTVRALTGAVFRLPPQVELPTQIEYLMDDADNNRLSLESIAQRAVSSVLSTGRYVVMADYPEAPENATAEETAGLSAYIACYPATELINWHETRGQMDLAVLREFIEEPSDDGFSFDLVKYYRVLRLRDGKATIQLYRESTPCWDEIEIVAGGVVLDELPIVVIGAEDNDLTPDTPPISDISSMNIALYRNSADYEEGCFLTGQPMLHIDTGDTSASEWQAVNPDFQVGSRKATISSGGSLTLVQAESNKAAMEAMTHKENQMVRLGAQIIMEAQGNETAEGARIRSGAEQSVLHTVTRNVSAGFEQALRWAAMFMGANPDDVSFELNRQFFDASADPQLLAQMIMMVDRGAISKDEVRNYARRTGLVDHDVTNEDLEAKSEAQSPY